MKKRKAVFLDRDGTIVVNSDYLSSPDQLRLLPNAAQGIRLFKEYGYLVIVVTNQSGIARGFFDEERLSLIHKKMIRMLGKEGAAIDDLYYCPHHPSEGILRQYAVNCACRKPKPGLLLEAARKYNIDLTQSLMIGDSVEYDTQAGKNAGCKRVLICGNNPNNSFQIGREYDYAVKDLLEAARLFI